METLHRAVAAVGLWMCSTAVAAAFPAVERVTGPEALALDSPVWIDVRSRVEQSVSTLPHAVCVDYGRLEEIEWARIVPHGATVVLYCSVGYRSARAAVAVAAAVPSADVHNLDGGIFAWANRGGRLVRNGTTVADVHPYGFGWGVLLARARSSV